MMSKETPKPFASAPDPRTQAFSTHTIIHPPDTLKAKAAIPGRANMDTVAEALRRADKALEALSVNFNTWMKVECDRLVSAFSRWERTPGNKIARDLVYRIAHDIKGQAATLEYPLISRIADSLRRLMDIVLAPDMALVKRHVDAIAAMIRVQAKGDTDPVARELTLELERLSKANCAQHNDDSLL